MFRLFLYHNVSPGGLLLAFALLFGVFAASPLVAQEAPDAQDKAAPSAEEAGAPAAEAESAETAAGRNEATPPVGANESIFTVIAKGGLTMIPLAIVSTLIVAFMLERFFYFRRKQTDARGYFEEISRLLNEGGVGAVQKFVEGDTRLLSTILRGGLFYRDRGAARVEKEIASNAQVELGNLERGLNLLANMGNLAPLIGFLGTVVGMRNSFLQFVLQAAPTAQDLAGGVEEALITTVAGLLIAIPTYLVYNLFIYRIDTLTTEVERVSTAVLSKLEDQAGA